LLALPLSRCAYAQDRSDQENISSGLEKKGDKAEIDPYEGFNRSMFSFNDHLDDYVAKPISDAYLWVTPGFLKHGITNFFSNLKDINVVLNDHMQGKFQQGAEDTGRFLTNSTIGFFGLIDVATDLGLKKHEEDFGQTLAVWGVPQGPYLVLPILGPTTTRGLPGSVFDVAANPSSYVGIVPVQVVSMLNTRANADGALKFIDEAAIDPYVFTREAFLQYQQHLITDGKVNASVDVLPLEDEVFGDTDSVMDKKADKKIISDNVVAEKKSLEIMNNNPQAENVDNQLEKAIADLDNGKQSSSLAQVSDKPERFSKKYAKKGRKARLSETESAVR